MSTVNDDVKQRGLAYAEYLSALPPEKQAAANERARKQGKEEHKAFSEKFKAGQCWVCGEALTAFNVTKPCPHWLLKPDGFGKEHFELITKKFGWLRLEHYLR